VGFFPVTKHSTDSDFNRRIYQRVAMWMLQPLIERQDVGFNFVTENDSHFIVFPVGVLGF
jgi:hypothetical protein